MSFCQIFVETLKSRKHAQSRVLTWGPYKRDPAASGLLLRQLRLLLFDSIERPVTS